MKKVLFTVMLFVILVTPVLAQPECPPPGAVDLVFFVATPQGRAVFLEWETAQELDNLGFNIYRSESLTSRRVLLNASLIPAKNPGLGMGAYYSFVAMGRGYFWLEDIDADMNSTVHEPVLVPYPRLTRRRPVVWFRGR